MDNNRRPIAIRWLLSSLVIAINLFAGESKVFNACELAQELRTRLAVNNTDDLATWVCIAQHQSYFNTAAFGAGGYYGLYQIGSEFWCDQYAGAGKACGVSCSQLMDEDIYDDFQCNQVIFAEHQRISGDGFNAWTTYQKDCSNGRARNYIDGCFDHSNHIVTESNAIYQQPKQQKQPAYVPSSFIRRTQNRHSVSNDALSQPKSKWSSSRSESSKSRSRIYDRCELAQELVYRHDIPMDQVAMWVCIAKHESNYNTSAIGTLNADGSADHGLFQISDIYWCSPPGKGWACGLPCSQLEDEDITDDVQCMKKIYKEHQGLSGDGFNAWTVYPLHCKGRADRFVDGCFDDAENEVLPKPGIVAPLPPKRPPTEVKKWTTTKKTGRVYERCELARDLVFKYGMEQQKVATWVCIAERESNFNTSAIGRLNRDGSEDHGLFQISDIYWCSPTGIGGVCGLSCDNLEDDDITDDVNCMKTIYAEHQGLSGDGFNAWSVYKPYCSGNVERYVEGCFSQSDFPTTSSHRPGIVQPTARPQYPSSQQQPLTGKVYTACELANELMTDYAMEKNEAAMWVCIAQHESTFNTSAIGRLNGDGSEDHGLFQVSDLYWCDRPAGCGLTCEQLRDNDISNDVQCIRKIYKEHQRLSGDGYTAWAVYNVHCKGRADPYISGCTLRGSAVNSIHQFDRKTTKSPVFYPQYSFRLNETKPIERDPTVKPGFNSFFGFSTDKTTQRPLATQPSFPFYVSKLDDQKKAIETTTRAPWSGFTTRKTFDFATTPRPVFAYPTSSRTTTKSYDFLSKRPWIQTTNTIKDHSKTETERKTDFSLYDFYLKGTKFATQKGNPIVNSRSPYNSGISSSTRSPITTINHFYNRPATQTTPKPLVTFNTQFNTPSYHQYSSSIPSTTTTARPTSQLPQRKDSKAPAFNIFDLYLQRKSQFNQLASKAPAAIITTTLRPISTTGSYFNVPKVETTTPRTRSSTEFDPFSVYKFNRNAYQPREKLDLSMINPTTQKSIVQRSPEINRPWQSQYVSATEKAGLGQNHGKRR